MSTEQTRLTYAAEHTLFALLDLQSRYGADDRFPVSQIAQTAGISDRGVQRALPLLIEKGFVVREYVCEYCGGSLGHHFEFRVICPHCGRRIARHTWARFHIQYAQLTRVTACRTLSVSYSYEEDTVVLPHDAESFLTRCSHVLNVFSRRQIEECRSWLRYAWHKHPYHEWALALMTCNRERIVHEGLPIYSLRGLLRWALQVNAAEETARHDDIPPDITSALGRITHAFQYLDETEDQRYTVEVDQSRLYTALTVETIRQSLPALREHIDAMAEEAGRLPRTLERIRPAQDYISDIREQLGQAFRKDVC